MYQNNRFCGNRGPSKIRLLQFFEVLLIHFIDAICISWTVFIEFINLPNKCHLNLPITKAKQEKKRKSILLTIIVFIWCVFYWRPERNQYGKNFYQFHSFHLQLPSPMSRNGYCDLCAPAKWMSYHKPNKFRNHTHIKVFIEVRESNSQNCFDQTRLKKFSSRPWCKSVIVKMYNIQ